LTTQKSRAARRTVTTKMMTKLLTKRAERNWLTEKHSFKKPGILDLENNMKETCLRAGVIFSSRLHMRVKLYYMEGTNIFGTSIKNKKAPFRNFPLTLQTPS
jgi:hypothetical protein